MRRPPRPHLSAPMILDAAARVLAREGHAGLTMRAVAGELGVQAPAIYWHFQDKQALELALYDHLMGDLTFAPAGRDWREDVRKMASALRRKLTAHRDMGRLIPVGFFFAPYSMALLDTAMGVLMRAGLSAHDAGYGFTTLFDYVANWARCEAELRARPHGARPGLDEAAKAAIARAYPNVAAVFAAFPGPGDLDEQFAFGLDLLIAGLERRTR